MNNSLIPVCRLLCLALALSAQAQAQPARPGLPALPALDASADGLRSPMACLLEPSQVAELGSATPGVLKSVLVQRGDSVKPGQVVAEFHTQVDQATLQVRQAEAEYLERVVARNADLFKRNLLPAGDYDEMNSRSRQAQLQVALQRAILEERKIKSPLEGVVAERYAAPGDRVNDNKILRLAQINPLLVKVVVPEGLYGKIKSGDSAQVSVNAALSSKPLSAKVWRIDKVMDAASGTFTVLLQLENKGNAIPAGVRCAIRF